MFSIFTPELSYGVALEGGTSILESKTDAETGGADAFAGASDPAIAVACCGTGLLIGFATAIGAGCADGLGGGEGGLSM